MGQSAQIFAFEAADEEIAGFAAAKRVAEALLFAANEPLDEMAFAGRLPRDIAAGDVLEALQRDYAARGVNLVRVQSAWLFRTAPDLAWLMSKDGAAPRKMSRAAVETLAIIAYHQPVTRAEIEEVRGVAISRGTLDVLMETGWVRLRGRRRSPGRPVTYGTTAGFLVNFGLENISDLPGLDELKGAGLFDGRLPKGFGLPRPSDDSALTPDEEPLETFDEGPAGL